MATRAQELKRDPGDLYLTGKGTKAQELARDPHDLLLRRKTVAKRKRKHRHGGRHGGHFIQEALGKTKANPRGAHPGALHSDLGIPQDQKIPHSALVAAARSGNTKTAERARFALMLSKVRGG